MEKKFTLCKKLSLFDLEEDSIVVTVTNRLANYLRQEYDQHWQTKGKLAWKGLDVIPLSVWLERTWNECLDERILLTDFQEQLVWEKIILKSNIDLVFLRIDNIAEQVKQAWRLIKLWGVSLDLLKDFSITDVAAFVEWSIAFEKQCEQEKWISSSELPELLIEKIPQLCLPKKIILAGFDELPPKIESLIISFKNHNVKIEILENSSTHQDCVSVALPNQERELTTMVNWAKASLEKSSNIGCIIPGLSQKRDQVERIFTSYFPSALPFNLSIGKLLASYPAIHIALQILKLSIKELSLEEMSQLLRSPFIAGSEQEIIPRSALDNEMHYRSEGKIFLVSLTTLKSLSRNTSTPYHYPILIQSIEAFLQTDLPASLQLPSAWVNLFIQLLKNFGWPGERSNDSHEYQTLERWQTLLSEFAQLDFVTKEIDLPTALKILQQLANSIIFQPESKNEPIQILGELEAAGLYFDHLWVMGMDEESWPPTTTSNPFIPLKIQRQFKMPHSSAEHEMDFYRRLTERFQQSASHIIFSYPLQKEDHLLQLTPLLKNLPSISIEQLNLSSFASFQQLLFASQEIEELQDDQAPSITSEEAVKGGSNILKYQAQCPFMAFAKIRLGAENIPPPSLGLDASERGILLHRTMENLWNKIQTKEKLDQYSEQELETIISLTIQETLHEFISEKPLTFKKRFMQIEQQRLKNLLLTWLKHEKQRGYFKVIAKEQSQTIALGKLKIKIRIDRIDQLEDGSQIIIDYKTNEPSIKDWFGTRLEEPQLPLYCINNNFLSGAAFAQVKIHEIRFKGITISEDLIPGVISVTKLKDDLPQNWQALTAYWQENLLALSESFCAGDAQVDPKDPVETCQYCDLKILCRVYEVKI